MLYIKLELVNFFKVISYQAQRLTTTVLNLSWLLNEARTRVIALKPRRSMLLICLDWGFEVSKVKKASIAGVAPKGA